MRTAVDGRWLLPVRTVTGFTDHVDFVTIPRLRLYLVPVAFLKQRHQHFLGDCAPVARLEILGEWSQGEYAGTLHDNSFLYFYQTENSQQDMGTNNMKSATDNAGQFLANASDCCIDGINHVCILPGTFYQSKSEC